VFAIGGGFVDPVPTAGDLVAGSGVTAFRLRDDEPSIDENSSILG
jgi:hypothetical protein